ncbi:MAG: 2-phosphosulfolactate phosphatase [Deltaproteobacteria bacterium]|nr:2-phosphosulfolactate phosphatase [Deltaproteobacteria bacterium]
MRVLRSSLLEGARSARGSAVVVDVFRAFSCTPLLLSLGVRHSNLVATPEEALALKAGDLKLILIGEVGGVPIEGFDLGNSPSQILRRGREFFAGKAVVQRTSAGVQGALAALEAADEVLLGSFMVARATAAYLQARRPEMVSLVAMGVQLKEKAPEDEWCVAYLSHLLDGTAYDHNQALREIIFQETTQKFLRRDQAHFPAEDPILCLQRDIYDFVLKVTREGERVVVRREKP